MITVNKEVTAHDISNDLRIVAMGSIDGWFAKHNAADRNSTEYLGNMPLSMIYATVISLSNVAKYIYQHSNTASQDSRLWSVHTQISIHLRQFVFTD